MVNLQCILGPIWIYIYVCLCYQLVAISLVVIHVSELCLYLGVLWDTCFFPKTVRGSETCTMLLWSPAQNMIWATIWHSRQMKQNECLWRGAPQPTPRGGTPLDAPWTKNPRLAIWIYLLWKPVRCDTLRFVITLFTRPAITNLMHLVTFLLTQATNVVSTALAPETILSTRLAWTFITWFQRQPFFETVNAFASPIFVCTFIAMPLARNSFQRNSWSAVVEASATKLIATSSTAPEMIFLGCITTAKPTTVFLHWIGAWTRRCHPAL